MSESKSQRWSTDLTLPSIRGAGKEFIAALLDELKQHHWTDHEIFGVHLAVEEAVVNAIKHGNQLDETKQVHIRCKLSADNLWVEIIDEGCGFNPNEVPDCTAHENLEIPNGRGIMLMRSFMSKVEYSPSGNCVILEKIRAVRH